MGGQRLVVLPAEAEGLAEVQLPADILPVRDPEKRPVGVEFAVLIERHPAVEEREEVLLGVDVFFSVC